jgi:hypothetical protein
VPGGRSVSPSWRVERDVECGGDETVALAGEGLDPALGDDAIDAPGAAQARHDVDALVPDTRMSREPRAARLWARAAMDSRRNCMRCGMARARSGAKK